MKELYLDANAHLSITSKALQAYSEFYKTPAAHGHPSSPSLPGRLAASALEDARVRIARALGASKPGQIIFTSSCTQACEWGIKLLSTIDRRNKYTIYSSQLEHPAVRDAVTELENDIFDVEYLPVNQDGAIQLNNLDLSNSKVVCIHVQNEIGTIQPLESIKCRWLFSDLSQSVGKVPVNLSNTNIDIAAFGSHKFAGPGGFGFLYLKDPNWWEGYGTGSRYFLDRTGTPDVAGAVATAVALEEAVATLPLRTERMLAFQSTLETGLEERGFTIIGKNVTRSPNTSFVKCLKKAQGAEILFKFSEMGIYIGLGSACGSMFTNGSPLMQKLGIPSDGQDLMRISQFGEYDDKDAIYFIKNLDKIL